MSRIQGNQLGRLKSADDLLICVACGTQFDMKDGLSNCKICDDPRQYVPPSGQEFTSLKKLREEGYKLDFVQEAEDDKIWSITVTPKASQLNRLVGIGQRALLIQTPKGNILWDLVCFLDGEAVKKINSLGGLSLIIISHPHFYTSWSDWAATFNVPVFLAEADREWLSRPDTDSRIHWLNNRYTTLLDGVTAIIAGGHFPGSSMLHTATPNTNQPSLFHADTIASIADAHTPDAGRAGHLSYTFMWSYPNMIPLGPDEVHRIWLAIKGFEIEATYGFSTVRYRASDRKTIPQRILDSAKIFVKSMGYHDHDILSETL